VVLREGTTSARVHAVVRDGTGRAVDPADLDVAFESSAPDLVSVDPTGEVSSVGYGRATIRLLVDGVEVATSEVRAGHSQLLPSMLVLSLDAQPTAQLGIDIANADGSDLTVAPGDVRLHVDHPQVVSVDDRGVVTAHKVPDGGDESPHITGSFRGESFGNMVDVVVFAHDPVSDLEEFTAPSVGVDTLATIGDVDYSELFADFRVLEILELGYRLEAELTGMRPFGGERQFFINYSNLSSTGTVPCGINGNPLRLGTSFDHPDESCFLDAFRPGGPHPHWGVYFHEVGHNFTLTSRRFCEFAHCGTEHGEDWVEGLATACAMYVAERIAVDAEAFGIDELLADSVVGAWLSWHVGVGGSLQAYVDAGADYQDLDADVVDDMLFELTREHGWALLYRFFSIFLPSDEPFGVAIPDVQSQATFFAAAMSAAVGQDLRPQLRDEWGFPVDDAYYDQVHPLLERWVSLRDPAVNAGADQRVLVGEEVTLEDAFAVDWEGDTLYPTWQLIGRPETSSAELNHPRSWRTSFVPDVPGRYEISLTASDGLVVSAPDTVVVNAASRVRRGSERITPD
jgi:hypothetical protein